MRRKRLTILFCSAMAVLLIGLPLDGAAAAGAKETAQAEGTALTYKTGNNISAQGENGFYYAWGTPEHYVLMEYGLGWSGSDTWHGTEPYSHIAGSSLHPGDNWGVMVVWVAGGSGKVRLNGHMEKGSSQGDGVTLGVYRQKNEGELETVFEKFVENGAEELKFPLDQEFDVSKGDSFVFYCDSGLAHSNSSDSSGCPFEITYFPGADYEADAELSVYLRAGRAGDVGGFQHIEGGFGAEVKDGTLTKKTVKTTTGCASVAGVPFAGAALAAAAALMARRKRK